LNSKTQSDILKALSVFVFFYKTKIENHEIFIRKIVQLIWHPEKQIVTKLMNKYYKIYFEKKFQ